MIAIGDALDLVQRLGRTRNYPRETEGELALAEGLQRASRDMEHARSIVRRCAELSEFCPTDHDLLTVASQLAPPENPEPSWTPTRTRCRFGRCDGHGWERRFFLVTLKGQGEFAYKEKTPITEAQYRELSKKVDRQTQWVYGAAAKCPCAAPTETRQLAAGERE